MGRRIVSVPGTFKLSCVAEWSWQYLWLLAIYVLLMAVLSGVESRRIPFANLWSTTAEAAQPTYEGFGASTPGGSGGTAVHDIYKAAGHDVAIALTFNGIQVGDGQLHIKFVNVKDSAKVSAIEVSLP